MSPRHRHGPKIGSPIRRAVVTSVVSTLALASVTITGAAVTLTNSAAPRPQSPLGEAPDTTATVDITPIQADHGKQEELAPPAQVRDLPVGIPDIALVVASTPQLDAVPDAALAAYQRSAAVLGTADENCRLSWALVAGVGQVVSGHGTKDGSELTKRGVVRPTLAGKALRGRDGKRLPDSDAGRLDGDTRFDRPVGPMQLSPATWAVVGVDSDGDGKRNPNDIDDAALAVSVLLCSGKDDLRHRGDRIKAVKRVNDGESFVQAVLDASRAYRHQMRDAYQTVPLVVPNYPAPSDLPLTARGDLKNDGPKTDVHTAPTAPPADPSLPAAPTHPTEPTPTHDEPTTPDEPTAPLPTDLPAPTHPPRDPEDDVPAQEPEPEPEPEPCPVVTEPEPEVTEPTDGDTPSDEPPADEPASDEPIVPPGCDTESTGPEGE